jgi:hypothetical protein
MPTRRRFLLFLIILAIMLLLKRAVGQENAPSIGWDPDSCWDCQPQAEGYAMVGIIGGLFWGVVSGISRVANRNLAMRNGNYFNGDLVLLNL